MVPRPSSGQWSIKALLIAGGILFFLAFLLGIAVSSGNKNSTPDPLAHEALLSAEKPNVSSSSVSTADSTISGKNGSTSSEPTEKQMTATSTCSGADELLHALILARRRGVIKEAARKLLVVLDEAAREPLEGLVDLVYNTPEEMLDTLQLTFYSMCVKRLRDQAPG